METSLTFQPIPSRVKDALIDDHSLLRIYYKPGLYQTFQADGMAVWQYGSMAMWMGIWQYGGMTVWEYSNMDRSMAVWGMDGSMAMCKYWSMAV